MDKMGGINALPVLKLLVFTNHHRTFIRFDRVLFLFHHFGCRCGEQGYQDLRKISEK
jgi:hypothetical protein